MSNKQQLQEEFWRNISDKYEQRISQLQSQIHSGNFGPSCDSGDPFANVIDESVFSITSEDLKQLERVEALVKQEKELQNKIKEMEKSLSKVDNVMKKKEMNFLECFCTSQEEDAKILKELEMTHWALRKENRLLSTMLAEAKEEMNRIIKCVEGPIAEALRNEKCRSEYLQKEIIKARQKLTEVSSGTEQLEEDLKEAEKTVKKLAELNTSLKEEKCDMECRYSKLLDVSETQRSEQEELVKQLQLAIQRKMIKCKEVCICGRQGVGYGEATTCPKCTDENTPDQPEENGNSNQETEDCICCPCAIQTQDPPPLPPNIKKDESCVCDQPGKPIEEATECTCLSPKTTEKETEDDCHCIDSYDVEIAADSSELQKDAEVVCRCSKEAGVTCSNQNFGLCSCDKV